MQEETKKNMYLEAKINVKDLRKILDAVCYFSEETNINVSQGKMNIKQVDQGHVCMINLDVKKELFEEYNASDFTVNMDIGKLNNLIKIARGGEMVTLKIDSKDGNFILVKFGVLERRLGFICNGDEKQTKVPDVFTTAKIGIRKRELEEFFKASMQIADHFKIIVDKETAELLTIDDDDKLSAKFTKGEKNEYLFGMTAEKKTTSMYSTDYAINCIRAAKDDTPLNVSFGEDKPVNIEYELNEGSMKFRYLIAPRIEEEK